MPDATAWWEDEEKFEVIPVHVTHLPAQVAAAYRMDRRMGGEIIMLIPSTHDFPHRPPTYHIYAFTVQEHRSTDDGTVELQGWYTELYAPGTAHTVHINYCHITIGHETRPAHNESPHITMKVKLPRR